MLLVMRHFYRRQLIGITIVSSIKGNLASKILVYLHMQRSGKAAGTGFMTESESEKLAVSIILADNVGRRLLNVTAVYLSPVVFNYCLHTSVPNRILQKKGRKRNRLVTYSSAGNT